MVAIACHFPRKPTTRLLDLFGLDKLHPKMPCYAHATTSYNLTCKLPTTSFSNTNPRESIQYSNSNVTCATSKLQLESYALNFLFYHQDMAGVP